MKVKLARNWGPYRAGRTVDVPDADARWLIQHNFGESSGDVRAPEQRAEAPGAHGPDPLAGGDATRRRPHIPRPERDPNRNYARTAEGAPPAAQRPGFGPEDRKREGEAGRVAAAAAADAESTATAAESSAETSGEGADSKKPARRRSSRSES